MSYRIRWNGTESDIVRSDRKPSVGNSVYGTFGEARRALVDVMMIRRIAYGQATRRARRLTLAELGQREQEDGRRGAKTGAKKGGGESTEVS